MSGSKNAETSAEEGAAVHDLGLMQSCIHHVSGFLRNVWLCCVVIQIVLKTQVWIEKPYFGRMKIMLLKNG